MSTNILTRLFDFYCSGANANETVLTPEVVAKRGIKTLLSLDILDNPRSEAQPLYLSNLRVLGQSRNLAIQATMGNQICARDADTNGLIWQVNVGLPIDSKTAIHLGPKGKWSYRPATLSAESQRFGIKLS